jgi:hypothetical protein
MVAQDVERPEVVVPMPTAQKQLVKDSPTLSAWAAVPAMARVAPRAVRDLQAVARCWAGVGTETVLVLLVVLDLVVEVVEELFS